MLMQNIVRVVFLLILLYVAFISIKKYVKNTKNILDKILGSIGILVAFTIIFGIGNLFIKVLVTEVYTSVEEISNAKGVDYNYLCKIDDEIYGTNLRIYYEENVFLLKEIYSFDLTEEDFKKVYAKYLDGEEEISSLNDYSNGFEYNKVIDDSIADYIIINNGFGSDVISHSSYLEAINEKTFKVVRVYCVSALD